MESIRSFPSTGFGLPRVLGGSAPASAVSRPARCYCTFGLQDSPSRLKRPSSSEAPAASSPPPPLRLLPGGANQFPGGNFTRSGPAPYTAHQQPLARLIGLWAGMVPARRQSGYSDDDDQVFRSHGDQDSEAMPITDSGAWRSDRSEATLGFCFLHCTTLIQSRQASNSKGKQSS